MKNVVGQYRPKLQELSSDCLGLGTKEQFSHMGNRKELEDQVTSKFTNFQEKFNGEAGRIIMNLKGAWDASKENLMKFGGTSIQVAAFEQLKVRAKVKRDEKIEAVQPDLEVAKGDERKKRRRCQTTMLKIYNDKKIIVPRFWDVFPLGFFFSLAFIMCGDAVMTKLAMETTGSGNRETWITAFVVGFVFAYLAHFFGTKLHEMFKGTYNRVAMVMMSVQFFVSVGLCWVLAFMRYKYAISKGWEEPVIWHLALLTFALYVTATICVFLHEWKKKGTNQQRRAYVREFGEYEDSIQKVKYFEDKILKIKNDYLGELDKANEDLASQINLSKEFDEENESQEINAIATEEKLANLEYQNAMHEYNQFSNEIVNELQFVIMDLRDKFEAGTQENIARSKVSALPKLSLASMMILCLSFFLVGCETHEPEQNVVAVMYDQSEEKHEIQKYLTEKDIMDIIGFNKDDESTYHKYGTVYIQGMTSKVNNAFQKADFKKKKEDETNTQRVDKYDEFTDELAKKHQIVLSQKRGYEKTSIYNPICKMAKRMNASRYDDANKYLVAVSDCMESLSVSFYKEGYNMIQNDPDAMVELLTKANPLPDLSGYTIILLYNSSFDSGDSHDAQFTVASTFWQYVFVDLAGADEVIIDSALDI